MFERSSRCQRRSIEFLNLRIIALPQKEKGKKKKKNQSNDMYTKRKVK